MQDFIKTVIVVFSLAVSTVNAAELFFPITSCSFGTSRGSKAENMPLIIDISVDETGVWSAFTDQGMHVRFRAFQASFKGGAKSMRDIRANQSRIMFTAATDSFGQKVIPGGAFDAEGYCSIVPETLLPTGWMDIDGNAINEQLPTGVTIYKK